jgi:hypothetical protein
MSDVDFQLGLSALWANQERIVPIGEWRCRPFETMEEVRKWHLPCTGEALSF